MLTEPYGKKAHSNTLLDIRMMMSLGIMHKASLNDWLC